MGRSDDELARRYVAARDRGRDADAQRLWEELLALLYERLRNMVHVTHAHLSPLERDEAISRAVLRLESTMRHSIESQFMGGWVNAAKSALKYGALDTVATAAELHRKETALLDAATPTEDGEVEGQLEAQKATEAYDDAQAAFEHRDYLRWAMPQLKGNRRRAVEIILLEGGSHDDVAAELDVTKANAYQLFSRGLRDLQDLKEQYDA